MFVDPLAEQFMGWTPYHYVHQNPINLIDPTGMSAENGEGGGFWSKLTSFLGFGNNSVPEGDPDDLGEVLDPIVIEKDRKPNWFQRNFSKDKLSNDWNKIKENTGWNHFKNYRKDMVGGTGAIRFIGFGTYNLEGEGEIDGIIKIIKVGDMSTYSFSSSNILQNVVEAISKGVSIESDENLKNWFDSKNRDPYVNHKYKKYGIYKHIIGPEFIFGMQVDTVLRKSQINKFNKDHQFDSIQLVPLLK